MRKISEAKKEILGLLWEAEKPVSLEEVSQKTGLKSRSVNMHLLGLVKLGHVTKSAKGYYTIADSGREAIGFPRIDRKFAEKVLNKTPVKGAFHFYRGINRPTGILSDSLVDLCEKIKTLEMESIEFHLSRGDFEKWISSLGDTELAKRLRLIQKKDLTGQTLREEVYRTLRSRCDEFLEE